MAALLVLRDRVIKPLFAGVSARRRPGRPKKLSVVDADCERLRLGRHTLFQDLGLAGVAQLLRMRESQAPNRKQAAAARLDHDTWAVKARS